jgi:receptor protein-tyrosine kinase
MSIVERAVQESQLNEKSMPAAVAVAPGRVTQPGDDSGPAPVPVARVARTQVQPDAGCLLPAQDPKPIIQLDIQRLREEGRLPVADLARRIDGEIRRIKWPLLNRIAGRNADAPARNNVIMVTSAMPGEGKTFVALNLALSIVRDREMRVILMDGDVARPSLTPLLGLEERAGLNEVLDDTSLDFSVAIYRTDVEGLFFVPAGRWHDHSPEFFASSRMPQVIKELESRIGHGVIILDSPPLLATNEAQVATRHVGQVLLVVRADETEQRAVLDAIALVDKSTPVGAVLNDVRPSALGRYYGEYQYGHGYGRQDL